MFFNSDPVGQAVQNALFERSVHGVAVVDRKHRVVRTNDAMDAFNGLKHDDRPVPAAAMLPAVYEQVSEHLKIVFAVGEPVTNAVLRGGRDADGTAARYLCDYLPAGGADHKPDFVIVVVRPMKFARTMNEPLPPEFTELGAR